ncbi:MAG: hypothetical protein KatS3mg040_0388 [Candidatus Kapaibacterium sp.]|nr:MAG: hypothetical protein KatS3mg040_0388 [Candidatus Kapabacteria bacterium]
MVEKVLLIGIAALGAVVLVGIVGAVIARLRRRMLMRRLHAAVAQRRQQTLAPQPREALPAPVQRYLRRAVGDAPLAEWIELWEEGQFRSFAYPRWGKLRARGVYTGTVPGMIWRARVWHSLLRWYTIELLYASGIGRGSLKLWGAFTLFDPDGPEANEALLVRVLMETVWFPTSLVPGGLLRWESLGRDDAARAVLSDSGITIRADFYFTSDGDVERIVTLDKYRDADTGYEREQCTMYCEDWQNVGGMRIPMQVRLEWNLESGGFEYMRRRIVRVRYR